jgi:hypothetical protein
VAVLVTHHAHAVAPDVEAKAVLVDGLQGGGGGARRRHGEKKETTARGS